MFLASGGAPIFCISPFADDASARAASMVDASASILIRVMAILPIVPIMSVSVMVAMRSLCGDERRSLPLQRRQARDRACFAGQLQDMQAGIDAIREIDIAAVVGLRIVALDHGVAATLLSEDHAAARLRRLRDR